MEPIAQNSFTITKALFFEGMLRVSREGYGKFAKKALLTLTLLWITLLIITLISGGDILHAFGYLAILTLIGIWISVVMPRSNAKRAFAKLQTQSGGNLRRTTRFFDDYLQITAENAVTTIFYSQVTQILTSKHLLILTCADKRGILLLLSGFSTGDAQAVRSRIEHAQREEIDHD